MDLGWTLYFLVVFGCGGLLLLALLIYLLRELVFKENFAWFARSRGSKLVFLLAIVSATMLVSGALKMVWVTRVAAIPGDYQAEGVWGKAALRMKKDGTFTEEWHFKNEYNGKPEGEGVTDGTWYNSRRDWLTTDIVLRRFVPLAQYDRRQGNVERPVLVMGYGGRTALEVDAGANIVFFK